MTNSSIKNLMHTSDNNTFDASPLKQKIKIVLVKSLNIYNLKLFKQWVQNSAATNR